MKWRSESLLTDGKQERQPPQHHPADSSVSMRSRECLGWLCVCVWVWRRAWRVPAPEEPRLVARGASPWNANGRAAEPRRGDRILPALRGFVVRGCCCPGAYAPGYRPSSLRDLYLAPERVRLGLEVSFGISAGQPPTGRSAATTPSRRFKRGDALVLRLACCEACAPPWCFKCSLSSPKCEWPTS